MDRHIVHFDLDSFFVAVEVKKNSSLNGKAVIIGGIGERGVVASCSYEARKYGVHSAMPARMARQLCPDAIFIRGNYEDYEKHSHEVNEIIAAYAPLFEQASIDEFYLDVSGMDKFIGCQKWTQELRQHIIKESGLPISYGLSVNKTVAKVATNEAKPNGALTISQPEVQPFLNPLKVNKIPGVGEKTTYQLRTMGVDYIYRLCQIHPEQLRQVFGKNGLLLHQRAHGIDHSPVIPYTERKSISSEHTFSTDSIDVRMLKELLTKMVMELAYKLRQERKVAACINVKLRYSNFETVNMQQVISYTALDDVLIQKSHELFDKLYNKRQLIRLIGVKLSKLISGYEQIDLFSSDTNKYNLYQAMDKIRNRFGEQYITLASTLQKEG